MAYSLQVNAAAMKKLLPLIFVVAAALGGAMPLLAQTSQDAVYAHAMRLRKLYLPRVLDPLMDVSATPEKYRAAAAEAPQVGIPRTLIDECTLVQALTQANVAEVQRLLPIVRAALASYRPEASIYPDKQSAEKALSNFEILLKQDARKPGALAAHMQRAGEIELAKKIKAQLYTVSGSVDQFAIENSLKRGVPVTYLQWRKYLKPNNPLSTRDADLLGNPIGDQVSDQEPQVPLATYQRLKAVVPDDFWAPFRIPK